MAKATVHNTPVVHLELSAEEAAWLRALLQSPIGGKALDEEEPWNRERRKAIFSALPPESALRTRS